MSNIDLIPTDPTLLPVGAYWMRLRFTIEDNGGFDLIPGEPGDYEAPMSFTIQDLQDLAVEYDLWGGEIHEVTGSDTSKCVIKFDQNDARWVLG